MMRAYVIIVIRQICSTVDVRGGSTSIPIAHSSVISLACNFHRSFSCLLGVYVPFTLRQFLVPSRRRVGLASDESIPDSISFPSLCSEARHSPAPCFSLSVQLISPYAHVMQMGIFSQHKTTVTPCACLH